MHNKHKTFEIRSIMVFPITTSCMLFTPILQYLQAIEVPMKDIFKKKGIEIDALK